MEARDASWRRETGAPTRSQKGGRTSPRGLQWGQSKTKEQGQRQGEKRRANLENLDILLQKINNFTIGHRLLEIFLWKGMKGSLDPWDELKLP